MKRVSLSVIMPAFNEEKTIRQVIEEHERELNSLSDLLLDWELICVDDASKDATYEILENISQGNLRFKILRHETNQGIYESFRHLFREARFEYVYQTASDGQWPAKNLNLLLHAALSRNLDLVIGVRGNRKEIYNWWRQFLSFTFNLIPKIFFGVETQDANGIKLGRSEIFKMDLKSKSFFGEVERIIKAKRIGYSVGLEPIQFHPRFSGKATGARWKNIFATIRDFLKFLFSK